MSQSLNVIAPFDGRKKKKKKKGLADDIKDLEMGDYLGSPGWALHAITNILIGGRFKKTREGNVTTEADIGVMRP